MTGQKTLYILRHAKAENGAAGQEDITRKLSSRGILAAGIISEYMIKKGMHPQVVLCSSAVRTRETLQALTDVNAKLPPATYSDKLYHASAGIMLSLLSELPDDASSALIIGHNPGLHQLCLKLAVEGDDELIDTMMLKFPTASLASFTFEGSWHDITSNRTTLIDFVTPSTLAGVED